MTPFLSIVVTKKADRDESAIYRYISETFGGLYADRFRERLIVTFQLLAKQPFIGRSAKQDNSVRVLLMNKQNKIVYKATESEITVLRILGSKTKLSESF